MRIPINSLFLLNITRAIKTMMNRIENIRVNVTLRRAHVAIVVEQKHAQRMRHIELSSVACLAVPHFSTFSHKQNYIREKRYLTSNVCVLIFSTKLVWRISDSKKNSPRY